MALFNLSVS